MARLCPTLCMRSAPAANDRRRDQARFVSVGLEDLSASCFARRAQKLGISRSAASALSPRRLTAAMCPHSMPLNRAC
jgi:hypothetical protein